ncbi:hypothetical protein PM082_010171 [Marasmius tenuissimus]|nr:hypothetical protein PM082_010171 [Marasmius tenuissimus]
MALLSLLQSWFNSSPPPENPDSPTPPGPSETQHESSSTPDTTKIDPIPCSVSKHNVISNGHHCSRNLVICIDGTSNKFSSRNTNVVELYSRLQKDENQLTYYDSGIGTYPVPNHKGMNYYLGLIGHRLDLMVAL